MASDNEKELQNLRSRLRDLADKSYQQNIFCFTNFLGLSELDTFWRMEAECKSAGYTLFGGYEAAERQVIRFGSVEELGYEVPFPIVCVHIRPVAAKFAENLSHRDFLGALMNLGIERNTLGDIKVAEKEAYLFCLESMAEFICDHLEKVRHTHVTCQVEAFESAEEEAPEICVIQVASLRIDACIAKVYNQSRSDCIELFRSGKVFVNGRLCENNAKILKSGETVNARGFGKFTMQGEARETRKGKLSVEMAVFR